MTENTKMYRVGGITSGEWDSVHALDPHWEIFQFCLSDFLPLLSSSSSFSEERTSVYNLSDCNALQGGGTPSFLLLSITIALRGNGGHQ